MTADYNLFEQRKRDHIELALMPSNQSSEFNVFDEYSLLHEAIPDFNFSDVSIKTTRFNQEIESPFIVSSMTAGHADSLAINRCLIEACSQSSWAMGVGSQRRELSDAMASKEWASLRQDFPNVTLFSNIGIAQIIHTPVSMIQRLIDSLEASALIVHCNPLQEIIQLEGTSEFKGSWAALSQLIQHISVPIIVKETGCGFSQKTLSRLNDLGVSAVDVSGLGGTHWGRIEGHRAVNNELKKATAVTFRNWGINSVNSIKNAVSINPTFEIWGSGGVRHGLDAAKLFALGATTVGFAKPMLEVALNSVEHVLKKMALTEYELKTALFCTGSKVLSDLKEAICL
jgi:isopentenyl-diphosphate delta-isomerase